MYNTNSQRPSATGTTEGVAAAAAAGFTETPAIGSALTLDCELFTTGTTSIKGNPKFCLCLRLGLTFSSVSSNSLDAQSSPDALRF